MDWTLSDIKSKIRRLTGRPDTGELTEADLTNAVNQYYRNVLPLEIPADALRGFASQAVAKGGGSYVLSPDVISVDHPVYLVGADGLLDPARGSRFRNMGPGDHGMLLTVIAGGQVIQETLNLNLLGLVMEERVPLGFQDSKEAPR